MTDNIDISAVPANHPPEVPAPKAEPATPLAIVAAITKTYQEDWFEPEMRQLSPETTEYTIHRRRGGTATVMLSPSADADNQCVVFIAHKERYRGNIITVDRIQVKDKPEHRDIASPRQIARAIKIKQDKAPGAKTKWSFTVNKMGYKVPHIRPVFNADDSNTPASQYEDKRGEKYYKLRTGTVVRATPKVRQSKKDRIRARKAAGYQNPDGN